MKNILFPTDFSAMSMRAFDYTTALARLMQAGVTVFHASGEQEDETQIDFSAFQPWEEDDSLSLTFHQETGKFLPSIHAHMEDAENSYDIIVMGTKGSSGLHEVFLDSNTVDLLHELSIHMLAVPDEATFDGALDQGVIVSKCRTADLDDVVRMIEWLKPWIEGIRVVHLDLAHTDDITGRVDQFAEGLKNKGHDVPVDSVWTTDVEKDLTKYCTSHRADLVMLAHHKSNPMSRLVHYDLASRLTNHLHLPVFTYVS